MTSSATSVATSSRPRWPWALLGLALLWSAVLRVPLILNAEAHLDSDLAVDGLTLIDALQGRWRWHYPGTPHIGIVPVLLSWPQAMVWGANPMTLVSGGTVAYLGLVVATFGLAWRSFGPRVAAWSLVPLAFASTGTLWLSGRITGGHLLSAVWHAGAFFLLHACLSRGGPRRGAVLGLWCGLGIYVDLFFAITLAGLVPAAVFAWWLLGHSRSGLLSALAFVVGFGIGIVPREVGARLDQHDAYRDQFLISTAPWVLLEHARILTLDCFPRLIVGHRLPRLEADPNPAELAGPAPLRREAGESKDALVAVLGLTLFLAAAVSLAQAIPSGDVPGRAVALGLLVSSLLLPIGFVLNRNIYNADNYRYLISLLVPWAIGFGLAFDARAQLNKGGLVVALAGALLFAGLMTFDAARWYAQFEWIDARGVPVRKEIDEPELAWLNAHPEFPDLCGSYWDVYRLSFLTGGRVRGLPYPIFPNRFPEWSRAWAARGHPSLLLYRPSMIAVQFRERAFRAGGQILWREHRLIFINWP